MRKCPWSYKRTSIALSRSRNLVPAVALVALTILSTCASTTATGPHSPALAAPLSSSSTTSSAAWAIVPMGHLDDPLNTFWQVLYRPTDDASWTVVTPAGVADNGGLVLTTGILRTVTVGFEPSQNLHYSPLALSSDDGSTWSPGIVSGALSPDPDVLAGSDPGSLFAVVRSDGSRVLGSASSGNTWRTIVGRQALEKTSAGAACRIGELTAVTVDPLRLPLIGTTCASNRVGIFSGHAGDWTSAGPRLPDQSDAVSTGVLRMVTTTSGVSSLLEVDTRRGSELVASWSSDGRAPWTVSPSFFIGLSRRIISTAVAANGGFVVELENEHGPSSLLAMSGPGAAWQNMGLVPMETETVVANPNGAIDALSVNTSQLIVWVLDSAAVSWTKRQVINVPIDYGSSN